jgi:RNAse (barnase) inhibitor barstar
MPKKIVVKISGEAKKTEEPQPGKEPVPTVEPIEQPKTAEISEEIATVQEPEPVQLTEEDMLEKALKEYDELQQDIQRQREKDKKLQELCVAQEIEPRIIRNILARFLEERKRLIQKAEEVLKILREAKEALESQFAKVEEELIWSSIELNTMQMETGKATKSVTMKEELEVRIAQLRKELPVLRNRVKAFDEKIRELSDIPKTVVDLTTEKEIANKIFEDVRKKFILMHGPRAEAMLRAEIEKLAQAENLPREYATILVWRRFSASPS